MGKLRPCDVTLEDKIKIIAAPAGTVFRQHYKTGNGFLERTLMYVKGPNIIYRTPAAPKDNKFMGITAFVEWARKTERILPHDFMKMRKEAIANEKKEFRKRQEIERMERRKKNASKNE